MLQNRLAANLHDHAVQNAAQLPPSVRQRFIAGFSEAASGGLEVGRQSSAAVGSAPGLPPQVAALLARVAHDTFAAGFVDAMRPTLLVPIVALVLGSLSCLAVRRRQRARQAPPSTVAEPAA